MEGTLFAVVTLGVIPFWGLLMVAPDWRWTQRLAQNVVPLVAVTLVYVWALASDTSSPEGAGFTSLEALRLQFSTPTAILVAWTHFIVLDLFAGAWIVRDARRRGIGRGWTTPILVLTFALAPIGLTIYLIRRAAVEGSTSLASAGSDLARVPDQA